MGLKIWLNGSLVERDEATLRRLHHLENELFPNHTPQERYYSWPSLAGRLGIAALKHLVFESLQAVGPFATDVRDLQP